MYVIPKNNPPLRHSRTVENKEPTGDHIFFAFGNLPKASVDFATPAVIPAGTARVKTLRTSKRWENIPKNRIKTGAKWVTYLFLRSFCYVSGEIFHAPLSKTDAVVVGHLRNAGALFIGRANMSEFAFSGMGLNPHYGTPKCIWDRATGRLPGGSSSGGAVSVAEGIVPATVGSDTAGSCRVPAAFNGIVGVKPTYGRLSLRGVYPLSPTSDAPGPLANDLDGCFILDHVMRGRLKHGEPLPALARRAPESLRLLAPESAVMEALDPEVAAAFERALGWLESGGVHIAHAPLPALEGCVDMFSKRAVAVFEAWQAHHERLRRRGDEYDSFVRQRMSNGRDVDAAERQKRYREKADLVTACAQQMHAAKADALLYPTAPCIPPAIAETNDPERMPALNLRCLRNASTVNFFDGCAVSLPCHTPGEAPVGLMLAAGNGEDDGLYEMAGVVEGILDFGRE